MMMTNDDDDDDHDTTIHTWLEHKYFSNRSSCMRHIKESNILWKQKLRELLIDVENMFANCP